MAGASIASALLTVGPPPGSIASSALEERKLPMRFAWNACGIDCQGWVSAVGIVDADTPAAFEEFANGHDLRGATIILDSSGGSVNDAIALGRRWRKLGVTTSVGTTISSRGAGVAATVQSGAYCESMCVFLLLSGQTRYVPEEARVRVHQIWMGDRAHDARNASYTAQDLTIVERDIGRLAQFAFDMGGTGDLLALALSVPPWESLHEMSPAELRSANLITTETRPLAIPGPMAPALASLAEKRVTDRFNGDHSDKADVPPPPDRATRTADATGARAASSE